MASRANLRNDIDRCAGDGYLTEPGGGASGVLGDGSSTVVGMRPGNCRVGWAPAVSAAGASHFA